MRPISSATWKVAEVLQPRPAKPLDTVRPIHAEALAERVGISTTALYTCLDRLAEFGALYLTPRIVGRKDGRPSCTAYLTENHWIWIAVRGDVDA